MEEGGVNQTIEMPVWVLLVCLAVAWATAWANAWVGMRLARRNGLLLAQPLEVLDRERARRELQALRGGGDGVLPAEYDGRVVE